jgi:hypothetical protein
VDVGLHDGAKGVLMDKMVQGSEIAVVAAVYVASC